MVEKGTGISFSNKEATLRGRKACSREGRMAGGFHKTYGYDYVKVIKGEREARRVINENEASWARQMFEWLVNEVLRTNQILFRLRAHNAPTKSGKIRKNRLQTRPGHWKQNLSKLSASLRP